MAGTKVGGKKASKTCYTKYGRNFYRVIGAKGGKASKTGGFYKNSSRAQAAGYKGGAHRKLWTAQQRQAWYQQMWELRKVNNV